MDIRSWREDYDRYSLNESELSKEPFSVFKTWFDKAIEDQNQEPNAMILSTCFENKPNSRVVLLKEIEEEKFIFYTNYQSQKGVELESNPNVSLLFFWQKSQRQVRIKGIVSKLSYEKAVEYFNSRPEQSRISAISSPQSQRITKSDLISRTEQTISQKSIECPENWGGYSVEPSEIEFWQGQPARLHDRIVFKKLETNDWEIYRLAP